MLQQLFLGQRFHPLGHHFYAQCMPHADDGTHDGTVALIFRQTTHEGLIHLEFLDGQLLEIAQVGVPRPEVINGQANTQVAQKSQTLLCFMRILEQDAFRQLQFQPVSRELVRGQQRSQPIDKVRLPELQCRYVDRHHHGVPQLHPSGALTDGLLHDPGAQGNDVATLLRQRNEHCRRHRTKIRIPPPKQGFGTRDATCLQIDLRLVMHSHAIQAQCLPHGMLQLHAR